jgi:hypothetical protein
MANQRSFPAHRPTTSARESFDWRRLPPALVHELAAACAPSRGAYANLDPPERLRRWIGPLPTPELVGAAWSVLRDVWLAADADARHDVALALHAAGLGGRSVEVPDDEWRILGSAHDSPVLRRAVLARLVEAGRSSGSPADHGPAWAELRDRLARVLSELADEEYLIVCSRTDPSAFVQFRGQGAAGLRIEAPGPTFANDGAGYRPEQLELIARLGFEPPTPGDVRRRRAANEGGSTYLTDFDESVNFHRDFPPPVPAVLVADLAVSTLCEVHGIGVPAELVYDAFTYEGRKLTFAGLHLPQDANGEDGQREASERDRLDAMAQVVHDAVDGRDDWRVVSTQVVEEVQRLELAHQGWSVFVTVQPAPPFVRIDLPVVTDLDASPAAADLLEHLNQSTLWGKWVLVDGVLIASIDVPGDPLLLSHIALALDMVVASAARCLELFTDDGDVEGSPDHGSAPNDGLANGGYL